MTDFHDDDADLSTPKSTRKDPIPREHFLQQGVFAFTKSAINLPPEDYFFLSHDRSAQSGDFSHARQGLRGVRRGIPDTQLLVKQSYDCLCIWWEAKVPGNKPDGEQNLILDVFESLGCCASWGTSVVMYCNFLRECGVPLVANADYQAMMLDAKVAANIAKAEARRDGAVKTRSPKSQPKFLMSRRGVARIRKAGIPI